MSLKTSPVDPASRLPAAGTTIFTVMSALAAQHGAVNLSQGFPDFESPPELLALLDRAAREGHNQYAPMIGVSALREAIAEQVQWLYGAEPDVESEITITAGATQAIFTAIACMVRPGDEVIVFEPVYDSYIPAIELNGGTPVRARLNHPDYRPDWASVRALVTPRTRMIIINSPHNPSGRLLTADDLSMLRTIVAGTNIVIVSDEVYEHIVFDGRQHESLLRHPDLAARSFVISSFGKTFHITGWKIAHCIAPKGLMTEFRKAHQFIVFTVHAPSQYALAAFMQNREWYPELRALYESRRDQFRRLLSATPFGAKLQWQPCEGTYFQCVRYAALSQETDRRFVERLTTEAGVAAIPMSAFYTDGHDDQVIRFCFAKRPETLELAAERLGKWVP